MLDIEPNDVPLPDREWHKHLEGYLTHGELNPEILPFLDSYQMWCINEIKKTYARIEYRQKRLGDNPDESENDKHQGS